MSASLQWSIIRNNSSFLVKNLGNTFTKEPNNLTGKNAFKYNGLVNKKVVGIEASSDGKGVILVTKKKREIVFTVSERVKLYIAELNKRTGFASHNKPGSNLVSTKLSCNSRATLKCIRNACGKSHYRSDLEDAAVRRAAALLRSQRPTAVVQKRRTRKKQT